MTLTTATRRFLTQLEADGKSPLTDLGCTDASSRVSRSGSGRAQRPQRGETEPPPPLPDVAAGQKGQVTSWSWTATPFARVLVRPSLLPPMAREEPDGTRARESRPGTRPEPPERPNQRNPRPAAPQE